MPGPVDDTFAYARRLLQRADVAVAPGETFGAGGHGRLRISLATAAAELRDGLQRLIRFANAERRHERAGRPPHRGSVSLRRP